MASASSTFDNSESPLSEAATWATPTGWDNLRKVSGVCCADDVNSGEHMARYVGASFAADHYSEIVFASPPNAGSWYGAAARVSAGGSGYIAVHNNGTVYIYRVTNGPNFTELTPSVSASFTTADVLRIWPVGTSIGVYKNGSSIASRTDSNIASGAPGIYAFSAVGTDGIDSWAASDGVVSAGGILLPNGPRIPMAILAR